MSLRLICAGLAVTVAVLFSGCYCPRYCGYRPGCPPAVSAYPVAPACPCNGNGVAVQAFSGGPPVVANPYHP